MKPVFENSLPVGVAEPLERVSEKRAPDRANFLRGRSSLVLAAEPLE